MSDTQTVHGEYPETYQKLRARICHFAWACFQMGAGQPFNEEPSAEQIASQLDGLRAFDENPNMTSVENHENWMRYKLAQGWRWGPKKDESRKLHPDLVDFNHLPAVEREKDRMDLMARRFSRDIFAAFEASLSAEPVEGEQAQIAVGRLDREFIARVCQANIVSAPTAERIVAAYNACADTVETEELERDWVHWMVEERERMKLQIAALERERDALRMG